MMLMKKLQKSFTVETDLNALHSKSKEESRITEKTKLTYSLLEKSFEKKEKTI